MEPGNVLKDLLSLSRCPNAVMILGADNSRKQKVVKRLLDQFKIEKSDSFKKLSGASLKNSDLSELEEEFFSLSLFSVRSFVYLTNVNLMTKDAQDRILALLKNEFPDTMVILDGKTLPKNNALYKWCSTKNAVMVFEVLKGEKLRSWVTKELKGRGVSKFSSEVVDSLIELGDADPDDIIKAIEHLALYTGSKQLNQKDIASVFTMASDTSEFDFIDALASGQRMRAEILVQKILSSGKSPFALLGLLSKTFSQYMKIKLLQSQKMTSEEAREHLNMSPWVFDKNCRSAKKYSASALKQALKAILLADSKLKNKSLGAECIFEELSSRLLAR